jgi:ABC-type uncharacterized transport system involved in gliding motility auxiliary subunit
VGAASQPATRPDADATTQPTTQPATQATTQPDVGPPAPPATADAAKPEEKDPEPVFKGQPATLLVIGDSDFVRDDLITGEYQQQGGPTSRMGGVFFAQMLDWLAEDQDLLALRSKQVKPRVINFVERNPFAEEESPEAYAERVKATRETVRVVNVIVPPAILLVAGILVLIRRRTQKQTFLASVQD